MSRLKFVTLKMGYQSWPQVYNTFFMHLALICYVHEYQNTNMALFLLRAEGVKVTKSAIMNIFRKKKNFFKSFVKIELSYAFTINLFTTAKNCMEK